MPTPFICGSFPHQEQEDEDMDQWSLPSTPKRLSKGNAFSKSKERTNKNPYSDRGLDKFSALLADLDDKRRKIYTQQGSQDISLVRFVYTNPNDCKPIIVKVKDNNNKQDKTAVVISKDSNHLNTPNSPVKQVVEEHRFGSNPKWNLIKLVDWRRPSFYLPVFIIFILFFLAIFGRSFTILCTSIAWYLLPTTINGGVTKISNSKRPKKKKEYLRRTSDVKVASINSEGNSSPKSVITGMNDVSPRQHGHRKSW